MQLHIAVRAVHRGGSQSGKLAHSAEGSEELSIDPTGAPERRLREKSAATIVREKRVVNVLVAVPVLVSQAPLAEGEELVWRDGAWTNDTHSKARTAPVLVQGAAKKLKM